MSSPARSFLVESPLELLMVRFQQDDQDAASELIKMLSPRILRFLARPKLTRAYAEDMLQECWLRLYETRHNFRPELPLLPWIFMIARRTRCDRYRRLCGAGVLREVSLEAAAYQSGRSNPHDSAVYCSELISSLPKGQKEVLIMLKVDGLTLDEVARSKRSTTGAIKQKAHRAYLKLRLMHGVASRARTAA